ncbi:MAG: hypothetical protein ABIJ09_13885 [Pseudomonadota bacterium]
MKTRGTVALRAMLGISLVLSASAALAAEKKPAKDKDESADLFEALGGTLGDSKSGLGDLKQATKNVGPSSQNADDPTLSLRKNAVTGDGKVKVKRVFAARSIVIKGGKCVPKPERVTFFVAPEFPFSTDPLSVCAHLEGGAGRAMRMSVTVMTGRGKVIGSAESIADFTGKNRIEHAVDFPSMRFPEAGVYRYVIDIEGERVANEPLFEVRPPKDSEVPE